MAKTYRITLWSGGKPVVLMYSRELPKFSNGCVGFTDEDGNAVYLVGNISIEQGEFSERPITSMRMKR